MKQPHSKPNSGKTGPDYWRSLDELAERPEFREWVEREFPEGASELTDPTTRRHFLKIMSASFLLAGVGLTGCRRPVETIRPFGKQPERSLHGQPLFYATAYPGRTSAIALVVKSHEGRPTKIEGNSLHPDCKGAVDQFALASILNLYDPDRAVRFTEGGNSRRREEAHDKLAAVARETAASGGEGLCLLVGRSSSPSRARLIGELRQKYPKARWFVHEPVDFDIHRQAAAIAYGAAVKPYPRYDSAKVIVSLDCDFLGAEEDSCVAIRKFAAGRRVRKPGDSMNRLYVVEALYSLTGANADHRLRLPAGQVAAVAARMGAELLKQAGDTSGLAARLMELAGPVRQHEAWIVECAKDLLAHRGEALVVAGYQQPLAVHLIAHAMNAALNAVGRTLELHAAETEPVGGISELAGLLNDGKVQTLVILGGNPVYTAPANLNWKAAQRKAKTVLRLGYYEDETFELCDWHLPQAHFLESWGDARSPDGTLTAVQPLIEPLFGGMTELEVLARLGGMEVTRPYDIVRETFRKIAGPEESAWKKFLHDGFLAGSRSKPVEAKFSPEAVSTALREFKPLPAPEVGNLEAVFYRSASVDDGRFINNGWLMETPDPITKLTWDNAILLSPKTAAALGMNWFDLTAKSPKANAGRFNSPVVEVKLGNRSIRGPVWIQPGLADNTIGLALGYGQEKAGRIGRLAGGSPAGFNAYAIKPADGFVYAGASLTVVPGKTYELACTQEHGAMEGRPFIREANLKQFEQRPDFVRNMDLDAPAHTQHLKPILDERGRPKPIYKRPPLNGMHQWGMVIDLTACVGCTACAVACQSENNIPIVGKEQVVRGREMAWIRLDRYYYGDVDDPQIAYQPVACQHCENAPCENVCPVNATTHDEEGLNLMTYNRCVGTRYCSNNCPFKVRRFNFFDYNRRPLDKLYRSPFSLNPDGQVELARWFKDPDKGTVPVDQWDLLKLARNPDVTVRMRGVMEKCTFCIQRLEQAKISKRIKARDSGDVRLSERDGSMPQTACQQACPAEAIVFGDITDPQSRVSQLKALPHNYTMLGYLDVRPRTSYLARLRNPNPAMPDAVARPQPASMEEYEKKNASPFEAPTGADGHGKTAGVSGGKGGH